MKHTAQIAIVGAGPVGIGLAIDLAVRGHRVVVAEKHPAIQRIPKGQNLTQRSGEHFARWGVTEQIRAASPIPASYGNAGMVAFGTLLSGYHYDWFKRASVAQYYAATNERLPQYETETILRQRAADFPAITLLTGYAVERLHIQGDRVELYAHSTETGSNVPIEAEYVVGCDGANSMVREALGIEQTLDSHNRRMALLVFRSPSLDRLLERFPGKSIYNVINPEMQGYWQFFGRVDLNGGFFFHAPVPEGTRRDNFDFRSMLERIVGASFDIEFEHIGFWDLRFALANSYQHGRGFIAGDAAHSHPPYGGFGINTGLEDACNLSWKLSAVLNGRAPATLLDTYTTERHPVFASTRDDFIARMIDSDARFTTQFNPDRDRKAFEAAWQARAQGGNDEVDPFLPHYAGSSLVLGQSGARSGAVGRHSHKAEAGYHLSPMPLADQDRKRIFCGQTFSLICIDQPIQLMRNFAHAAEALSMPLEVIEVAPGAATDQWQASLILVRPDQFIAYAADRCTIDPTTILRQSMGYHND